MTPAEEDRTHPKDAEDAPVPLCEANLHAMPATIPVPRYNRGALKPGILHIGLGNFHRAHQAWYLHRLMQDGQALDWAIIGAGVRANDAVMRETLLAQDCLTTLIQLDPLGTSAEVTGAMIGFVPVEDGNGALIAAMADPAIRIVSLTVTEGGYYTDAATGGLDSTHADIRHDAEAADRPRTVFGAIIAALARRRAAGAGPFTVLSCDNLQGNGDITKGAVLGLARMGDAALAAWIEDHVTFPNSMVDCIVPATGPKEIALARSFGIEDRAPVSHEAYRQWVIEDRFCAGRPDWDRVGATFTPDVHRFEAMKIRILNGGHQVLANVGELLSVETIAGCMSHPDIAAFFLKVQQQEIAPHVAPVPGILPQDYVTLIRSRFANPAIHDTTRRVAFDGSSRHPGFILPVVQDALAAGTSVEGLALVEALWARMCAGTREDGSEIAANDPQWEALQRAALVAKDDPLVWLRQEQVYGGLADEARFAQSFAAWLGMIWQDGALAAIRSYTKPA